MAYPNPYARGGTVGLSAPFGNSYAPFIPRGTAAGFVRDAPHAASPEALILTFEQDQLRSRGTYQVAKEALRTAYNGAAMITSHPEYMAVELGALTTIIGIEQNLIAHSLYVHEDEQDPDATLLPSTYNTRAINRVFEKKTYEWRSQTFRGGRLVNLEDPNSPQRMAEAVRQLHEDMYTRLSDAALDLCFRHYTVGQALAFLDKTPGNAKYERVLDLVNLLPESVITGKFPAIIQALNDERRRNGRQPFNRALFPKSIALSLADADQTPMGAPTRSKVDSLVPSGQALSMSFGNTSYIAVGNFGRIYAHSSRQDYPSDRGAVHRSTFNRRRVDCIAYRIGHTDLDGHNNVWVNNYEARREEQVPFPAQCYFTELFGAPGRCASIGHYLNLAMHAAKHYRKANAYADWEQQLRDWVAHNPAAVRAVAGVRVATGRDDVDLVKLKQYIEKNGSFTVSTLSAGDMTYSVKDGTIRQNDTPVDVPGKISRSARAELNRILSGKAAPGGGGQGDNPPPTATGSALTPEQAAALATLPAEQRRISAELARAMQAIDALNAHTHDDLATKQELADANAARQQALNSIDALEASVKALKAKPQQQPQQGISEDRVTQMINDAVSGQAPQGLDQAAVVRQVVDRVRAEFNSTNAQTTSPTDNASRALMAVVKHFKKLHKESGRNPSYNGQMWAVFRGIPMTSEHLSRLEAAGCPAVVARNLFQLVVADWSSAIFASMHTEGNYPGIVAHPEYHPVETNGSNVNTNYVQLNLFTRILAAGLRAADIAVAPDVTPRGHGLYFGGLNILGQCENGPDCGGRPVNYFLKDNGPARRILENDEEYRSRCNCYFRLTFPFDLPGDNNISFTGKYVSDPTKPGYSPRTRNLSKERTTTIIDRILYDRDIVGFSDAGKEARRALFGGGDDDYHIDLYRPVEWGSVLEDLYHEVASRWDDCYDHDVPADEFIDFADRKNHLPVFAQWGAQKSKAQGVWVNDMPAQCPRLGARPAPTHFDGPVPRIVRNGTLTGPKFNGPTFATLNQLEINVPV